MKTKVAFCEKCDCYTEFQNLGKRKMTKEEILDKVEDGIFTLGIFPVMELLCGTNKRPTFCKCTKCGNIFEE